MWWEGLGLGPPGYRSQLALSSLPVRTRPLTAAWVLHGGRAGRLRCHTSVRDGLLMTRFHSGYMCDWFSFFFPLNLDWLRGNVWQVSNLWGQLCFYRWWSQFKIPTWIAFSFFVFYFWRLIKVTTQSGHRHKTEVRFWFKKMWGIQSVKSRDGWVELFKSDNDTNPATWSICSYRYQSNTFFSPPEDVGLLLPRRLCPSSWHIAQKKVERLGLGIGSDELQGWKFDQCLTDTDPDERCVSFVCILRD